MKKINFLKIIMKFLKRNKFSIILRNKFNIRPTNNWGILKNYSYSSISDSFLWRTDNGYSTIFKFTDILGLFYKEEDSEVGLIFYNKENQIIKKLTLKKLDISNEIKINSEFLNGIKDYGTFNIFHENKNKEINITINNRCYLGFSKDEIFYSYVHGNSLTTSKSDGKIIKNFYQTSLFSNIHYKVQNNVGSFEKTEVVICNPTNHNIKVYFEGKKYVLSPNQINIFETKKSKIIDLKSNCHVLRPLVFNYKNNNFDVYHG